MPTLIERQCPYLIKYVGTHGWMQIGEISSGAFSPCLKKNVAMGYVEKGHGKAGTKLKVCLLMVCRSSSQQDNVSPVS